MLRLVDGLLAGALIGGVWWYTRRDQAKADKDAARAERLAELAERRARLAEDRARAIAAGATAPATTGKPPPAPAPTAPAPAPTAPAPAPPPPTLPGKPAGLSRTFDDLFARHGRGIPVAFLRALAAAESGMNPNDRLGLINVVPVALADYNRRHPSSPIKADEMRDPAKNITVAADILRTIIDSYRKHHPDVPNLVEDWSNLRFAQLLVFGWNGGYSELARRWARRRLPQGAADCARRRETVGHHDRLGLRCGVERARRIAPLQPSQARLLEGRRRRVHARAGARPAQRHHRLAEMLTAVPHPEPRP